MAFINPIDITISTAGTAQSAPSFRGLVLGTGVAEKAYIIANKASWAADMLGAGYLSSDTEYKMVRAYFSQDGAANDIAVYRKATATDWDDALDALIPTFSDFWGVMITSATKADQDKVKVWQESRAFGQFVARTASTDITGTNNRTAWIVSDHLTVAGYQNISSSPMPFVGDTACGLTDGTYHLNIAIDGEAADDIAVAIDNEDTWAEVAAAIQVALRTATSSTETVAISQGFIVVTSATTGEDSSVLITDGTGGDGGLIAGISGLTDYTATIEDAVQGTEEYPDAAVFGRKLPKGYLTWSFKQLSGVTASDYTSTVLNTLKTNNMNWVQEQNGVQYIYDGSCESGRYIDTNYFIDYLKSELEIGILGVLLDNESVPFDNTGFAMLEVAMRKVFTTFGKLGTIAIPTTKSDLLKSDLGDYMYKLAIPAREDVPTNDRLNRLLSGVTANVVGSGAVHGVELAIVIE